MGLIYSIRFVIDGCHGMLPPHFKTSLGRVLEQILQRIWIQIYSFLIQSLDEIVYQELKIVIISLTLN